MNLQARLSRHSTALSLGLLALFAYVPALASSPGRMPADTKLYLYLDPGGLVGRAASTFEPDQFAGWVPHQQITYLWPSGPWYLTFDALGVPDWVAHRLWIATIMFLAGAGVLWASRQLGVSKLGALAGAMVYQLSPFLLAYVSRTSLLLLPWAGLGWIVGLTVRATLMVPAHETVATWRRRLGPWREPALIALIVATVGSTNATALAMIVPAPVLWILHVTWQGRLSWRRAAAVTTRIAVLCLAVSTWWIAMLVVQSRNGIDVLAYSETLEDVSRNATGSEVLRGLGYWLFYQRDAFGPTTTASLDYLVSLRTMAISYGIVLVGLAGLAVTSWAQRRYAALCLAVGFVLAVGVHPIDSPSPFMAWFAGDDESGLALALRSSTRAVPVFLFGISLGAAALVTAVPRRAPAWLRPQILRRRNLRLLAALGVGVLAVVNLPSLWTRTFVDPAIDRDQDPPAAWSAAVDRLETTDTASRVLQLPGQEFGAFRWGYTTDHPLVGLTDKPVVTRDLIPFGSPGAMDLLYALDDRVQEGTIESASLAPIARLLGSDVVWLSNDSAFERFRTARPEVLDAALTDDPLAGGLSPVERFGEPQVNVPEVPMDDPASIVEPTVGRPVSPVALLPIADPLPVIRAKAESVVVSGSGDGLVDAAAAGLVSGEEAVRYSASLTTDELAEALWDARALIVTDTNRDQARHWRGSQDVRGHTEPGGSGGDVLDPTAADQRLDVFPEVAANQTVARQVGPVTATASSYGEPFAYRPEDRAFFAIDGDPGTAWRVADHGDPIGERIRLDVDEQAAFPDGVTSLRLLQPTPARDARTISTVDITVDGQAPVSVVLDDSSLDGTGQDVTIPTLTSGGSVTIEITGITPGRFPTAASFAGVGFSEIDLGLGPTTEVIRVPTDGLGAITDDTPLALVFTRWRTDPTDPWRADPEPTISRQFELPDERTFDAEVTLRLDQRATDALLADFLSPATSASAPIATSRITGGVAQRGTAALDGDGSTSWVTGFDEAVGSSLQLPVSTALGTELMIDQPTGPFSTITDVQLRDGDDIVDLVVPAPNATGRSTIALPADFGGSGTIELTITGITERTTIDRRYGDPRVLPAAIAEISTDGIEPVAVDRSAAISLECSEDFVSIDGRPVPVTLQTTVGELLDGAAVTATSCEPSTLGAGAHDLRSEPPSATPLHVDRVVLTEADVGSPALPGGRIDVELLRNDTRARDVRVAACPDGCWVVLGEGLNEAWSATADGVSLGRPELIDGGFNGWWLPPTNDSTLVEFRWTAQRPVSMALAFTAIAALLCVLLALAGPRSRMRPLPTSTLARAWPTPSRRRVLAAGTTLVVAATLLVSPAWGVAALVPAAAALLLRRRWRWGGRIFEVTGLALALAVACSVLWVERRDRPFPNAGWTTAFDHLNGRAAFAVIAVAVGAVFAADAESRRVPHEAAEGEQSHD
jgi:arabinofuranan 3-O-arabinosyltransferase